MQEEAVTTKELLEQWREATRAAELAERLARMAEVSATRADEAAVGSEEIARMAERAADAAEEAAASARAAADRATVFARQNRAGPVADAEQTRVDTRAEESVARTRYHDGERQARERHSRDGST